MNRLEATKFVQETAKITGAFDRLESRLANLTQEALSETLLVCGVIPERFSHDSSEEKLWAKYCDILLSTCFNHLGITSSVLRARGNSADVFGGTSSYTIVGDAKAFRLSRTAKNQKDFKVQALDDWRKENTYACLISPLYQYPTDNSQIYQQAESKNVTLLSYIHLRFLIDCNKELALENLWMVPKSIIPSNSARAYWNAIDDTIVQITNKSYKDLKDYKQMELDATKTIGNEEISYWQSVIQSYSSITKEEAVRRLIKAEKIEEKINTIRRTIIKEVSEWKNI